MDPVSIDAFWAWDEPTVLSRLSTSRDGLSNEEARRRLAAHGPNRLRASGLASRAALLWRQVSSPLLLLLLFAAGASLLTGAWVDAGIVLTIVTATVGIGFSREHGAQEAVAALQRGISLRATVRRGGVETSIPVDEVVPGDIILLAAGGLVPADALLVEATDLFVSESALTGESFPVHKTVGGVPAAALLHERTGCVFLGTNVRSGTATAVVARTGRGTAFGAVAERLNHRATDTEFDRGLRHFGYVLTSLMLVLVLLVFAVHVANGRPAVETLLFAVALAVGLSPELLPAVLSVNLARGAQTMAAHGVVVRRLNAIENLGSMDTLCTDKTGTLTAGVVDVEGAYAPDGHPDAAVRALAAVNAALETGIRNVLDDALLSGVEAPAQPPRKLAEVPFDFVRKRSSVIVAAGDQAQFVTKGTPALVLDICTHTADGAVIDPTRRAALDALVDGWSARGIRVLAVATRTLPVQTSYGRADECEMQLAGFVTFLDQPKPDAAAAVDDLKRLGVTVKMLSGDSAAVARHVALLVGLRAERVITGRDVDTLTGGALRLAVDQTDVFAEVDPNQKERIIAALRAAGRVVGFLGDGVNDAPAMHAADTSLSVEHAVDVARETADFVLMRQHLDVIRRGIEEGRRTFANTLKYMLTTTSANLGNMVSMAAASLLLPFLPLLAGQILLNNFLSDIPALGIADDRVDPEWLARPDRWNMRLIAGFMVRFGVLSSLFDGLTFVALLWLFHATPTQFRTAWFMESLLSELLIALIVRTRRWSIASRPGTLLLWLTVGTSVVGMLVPLLPFAGELGFVPLTPTWYLAIVGIIAAYAISAEGLKWWMFRRPGRQAVRMA